MFIVCGVLLLLGKNIIRVFELWYESIPFSGDLKNIHIALFVETKVGFFLPGILPEIQCLF